MTVTEIDHGLIFGAATEGYVRSPGRHASDLYGALFKALDPSRYDKRDKDGAETPMDMVRIEAGTTFEEVLERAMAERLLGARPPEMRAPHEPDCAQRSVKLDAGVCCPCGGGIYFSPDYFFDIDGELVLGEFKLTWMSTKDAPLDKKFDKYRAQVKLYAHWLGINRARLIVYFINGDWKSFAPVCKAWEFEFTARELQSNFNMIMRFAKKKGLVG